MERVQFQQEQMLAELKDLVHKGLFTKKEIKQIIKKRTAFETALVRRVAKKADFLRYAAYEMQLEALRKKRAERIKAPEGPSTISDYALVRRQFHIYERALRKFKDDVGLWIQYIHLAKQEGARALVGRITARALQLHPSTPALYILAAGHELEHRSPSAARTLLQRGLRLNADSVQLWREYVKMELGFVESMRRRWEILGISAGAAQGKGKEKESAEEAEDRMDVDQDADAQAEADRAREEIMNGAIVQSVISSAVKVLPTVELFTALHTLLATYPSPPHLRRSLMEYLHTLLRSSPVASHPEAISLHATRFLNDALEGEELVQALKDANEAFAAAVRGHSRASGSKKSKKDAEEEEYGAARAYARFVEEWCTKPQLDDNLQLYLIGSLRLVAKEVAAAPLLAAHLRLLRAQSHLEMGETEKVLKIAKRYTRRCASAEVWLERLEVEREFSTREEADKAWEEARRTCAGDLAIWTWGLERLDRDGAAEEDDARGSGTRTEARRELLERLLGESMAMLAADGSTSQALDVHRALLIRYVTVLYGGHMAPGPDVPGEDATRRGERVIEIGRRYLPNGDVWRAVFESETEAGVLRRVYERWRRLEGEEVAAAVAWAAWLVRHDGGGAARDVVVAARGGLGAGGRAELEARWTAVLDGSS